MKFNNELWRIIGVFEVDNGSGKTEQRIKLIRNESIGDVAWDSNNVNDWTKATGMTLLNSGDYWNRTGTYSTTGLTSDAKLMIGNAKWYLGGAKDFTSASNGLTSHFYNYERGTTVYNGRPTSWIGKVGLMYPSDYGYATSGGTTINRANCLATILSSWDTSSDCYNNDWLLDATSTFYQRTIMPYSGNTKDVFLVYGMGYVTWDCYEGDVGGFRPSVYLKSSVEITDGTGTKTNPYQLTLPLPDPPKKTADFANLVGYDGLVEETHPATTQLAATTDYRYTGKNPNNYVKFNNELWRIIGVFDVDDGTGNLEQRIKIIRNESIGNIAWDNSNGNYSINDWSKATGMKLLNSGDYYNRTGSYSSTGLTEEAKTMIDNGKWYLGGTDQHLNATNFYNYERGTTVYKEYNVTRPTSWVGKVALMYPSDFGYATSGGTTTNREVCLSENLLKWYSDSSVSDCKNNDWLPNSGYDQWMLTPSSNSPYVASGVYYRGGVDVTVSVVTARAFHPNLYLRSDIKITRGTGTETAPYQLSL